VRDKAEEIKKRDEKDKAQKINNNNSIQSIDTMTSSPSLLPLPLPLPPSSNPCDYYRSSIPWLFIVPAIGGKSHMPSSSHDFFVFYQQLITNYTVLYLLTVLTSVEHIIRHDTTQHDTTRHDTTHYICL